MFWLKFETQSVVIIQICTLANNENLFTSILPSPESKEWEEEVRTITWSKFNIKTDKYMGYWVWVEISWKTRKIIFHVTTSCYIVTDWQSKYEELWQFSSYSHSPKSFESEIFGFKWDFFALLFVIDRAIDS